MAKLFDGPASPKFAAVPFASTVSFDDLADAGIS